MRKASFRFCLSAQGPVRAFVGTLAVMVLAIASPSQARSPDDGPEGGAVPGVATESQMGLGSYLAGRIARGQHDTTEASGFYQQALKRDPGNEALIEQALMMQSAEGRFEDAIALAKQLVEKQPTHRMAKLVLGLADAKAGQFAAASDNFAGSAVGVMGELTSALSGLDDDGAR